MSYTHGDLRFICDRCGQYLDISPYSSFPMQILTENEWSYEMPIIVEKNNILKENKLHSIIIKCDQCILLEKRVNKINKIIKK